MECIQYPFETSEVTPSGPLHLGVSVHHMTEGSSLEHLGWCHVFVDGGKVTQEWVTDAGHNFGAEYPELGRPEDDQDGDEGTGSRPPSNGNHRRIKAKGRNKNASRREQLFKEAASVQVAESTARRARPRVANRNTNPQGTGRGRRITIRVNEEEEAMRKEALTPASASCDESLRTWTAREQEILMMYLAGNLDLPYPPSFVKEIMTGEHHKTMRFQKAVITIRDTERSPEDEGTGHYNPAQLELQYAIRVYGGADLGLVTLARAFTSFSEAKVLDVEYARATQTDIYDNRYHTIRKKKAPIPTAEKRYAEFQRTAALGRFGALAQSDSEADEDTDAMEVDEMDPTGPPTESSYMREEAPYA
ncbi:uncharacterized protein PITG_21812 [Phytophthora infestans T30-4]|uniref:Uncharacterized protein n=1 Tax=Phytophthora infestans (strain T30-4) TaxID=403677 RepID=D0P4K9_PHYIT|nr:uncharacterized protein PITG_21812 [Phytophthora infestans T30-4]EEY66982.1 conserved hypothetical protein [Phytophthora infestans T30-4]|eukprot:XP_002894765.1 conserved hypothetical protein [Phytophthora infestans T30-4]